MDDAIPARPRRALSCGWPILATRLLAVSLPAGCTPYIGTTAASFLRKVREEPDPNIRYVAYTKLAQPRCYENEQEKAEAVKVLIAKLETGKEPVATRAGIINTLRTLGNPSAREAIVKLVSDPEPVIRVQACRALGKVGKPEDATILTRVMTVDTLEDCRIAAIDSLGELKPTDPRITKMLVLGMRHDDPATRLASLNALRKITGKDLGVDPDPWQKLIAPDGGKAPETLLASPAPASPSYPPRPVPPAISAISDPETLPARYPSTDPAASAPAANYPARNPNLPAPPQAR
jgi:hypothetical protein